MAYISLHKANSNHRTRKADGSMTGRYSRYEVGVIDGRHREIMAVIADQAGFDGMGFDASIGSGDDNWHVANVFTSDRRYVDTIAIGGADDAEHAAAVAQTQLDHLAGDNCVVLTNAQFDSLTDDKPNTWSLDSIEKLLSNPSQNKTFLPVITAQELNDETARVTFDAVQWDSMDGLISHKGNDSALYLDMVRADGHKQLLEPLNLARELELLGAEEHSFDALMDTKNRLSLMKDRLFKAMSRAGDAELSVTNVTETKPFKRQGVTNIAFVFDLSDGQKLSIWFHNPDSTPSKLMPSDIMISWKWMLNKRDVTAILSPKQGDNVQLPVLAARIMRVARKNSKKFKAAQARAAELEQELQDAQALVDAKQGEIDQLDTDIAGLNAAIDAAMAKKAEEPTTPPEMTEKEQKEKRERERVLAMQFDEVTQFYKNNGAEPSAYANDIIEKMLAKRLESIRANAEFVEYLAPYDTYNLLNDEPAPDVLSNSANNEVPPFSVGDPVVWRNEIGEMKGTFRGMVGQNIFIMTDDGQMGAPATEVFADDSAPKATPASGKSDIDAMITKAALEDFEDYSFWIATATVADVKALTEKQFYKLSAALEDVNMHGEHLYLAAMRTGNAEWIAEAKSINDANKTGLTPELRDRRSALWALINGEAAPVQATDNIPSHAGLAKNGAIAYMQKLLDFARQDWTPSANYEDVKDWSTDDLIALRQKDEKALEDEKQEVLKRAGHVYHNKSYKKDADEIQDLGNQINAAYERTPYGDKPSQSQQLFAYWKDIAKKHHEAKKEAANQTAPKAAPAPVTADNISIYIADAAIELGYITVTDHGDNQYSTTIKSLNLDSELSGNLVESKRFVFNYLESIGMDFSGLILLNGADVLGVIVNAGDESEATTDDNPEDAEPIVITGQEIEVGEDVDFKTAKNNAMAYFDNNLKDKVVFCPAIDSDVLLRRRGGKHIAKANNTFREKLKLVAAIPEMIKQGKYGHYTALNKEKGSNIAGYYVLNVEVKVGDVLRAARVVLEKNNEGEVLYDIGINKKEALAALGDTTSSIMLDGFTESSQYQGLLDESYQVNDDEVNQFDKLTTDNTVILNLFFDVDADADADADVINNKAIIEGRINESTTVNGTKVVSNFALVEAKELITSHDALGVANPDFPQELQPRDRSDKKSVDAIKLNAKNLQPEKLGDTEYAGNGAPIIGDDFLVESGNGRAIAIKSAYDNGDAGKYKEWLVNNATDFGLSADDVNGYNQPVLVRVRKTEIDRVEFAIEANLDANPSPLDDADAQATEPEAVEEPADTAPSKTVAIRDALDVLNNDVFKGQTDKVLMYTLNDAGDVVHRSFIKASSKSAQTRFTNKHLYEAGVKTVMTANIPDNNQAAARQLETLGYTIDYSNPARFTSDDYTVGDVYEMKRKDVFGNSAVEPDDTIIMEFTEWLFLRRRGEDTTKLRLATLSGSNIVNLTVAEMDAIVSRGDARRLMQPEIDAARDFEDKKLISTYVNNKGRVLAEVFLQNGVYDIKSSDGSSIGLADVGQVTEKLKAIKSRNASMKHQSGQDFLRDDGDKTYPPVEYDADEREYIAYMNNKKVDKWTAYQISGGDWAVVADNAQSRAFNSWNPKYFDTVDQLLAAYPAFKGIKALIAQAEQDDYESIDSSRFPSMFLERHADKLQTLGITDNDIQYRHDDDSDNLYVEAGIFKDKTLNYTDAVCNVVDAAISLYADVAVSDFNATVYQDSLFDSLTSQSKPTYGVTVQIVKFDATVRVKIDIDGTCEILQGASGEDVVATIKHRYTESTQAYIDAIDKAFQAQSDKKAADDAALQAETDKKEAENMKNTSTKSSNLSTAELRALAELGAVNYNFKDTTLESGEINDVDKRKIAYEFMDVLENKYGFSVGYKGRDFETIHISQMGFKTTVQTSAIVPFNQQDIDDIVNAYREFKQEETAAGKKEWWETTRASTSVYLIGDTLNDDYVRIKNRDGQIANNGDAFTYDFSVLIKGQGFEYGEDGSLAEIQAFVKEKTKGKGELRLVKGADVLAMNPQADSTPASDDNSELSKQLADLESAVNAEGFNPADFDTKGFIELVNATANDAELTARVMAISSVYQQKLVAASMAAMTSLAGGA